VDLDGPTLVVVIVLTVALLELAGNEDPHAFLGVCASLSSTDRHAVQRKNPSLTSCHSPLCLLRSLTALLARRFDYPDILRSPTEESETPGGRAEWWSYAAPATFGDACPSPPRRGRVSLTVRANFSRAMRSSEESTWTRVGHTTLKSIER
jgi:hypothetical protein